MSALSAVPMQGCFSLTFEGFLSSTGWLNGTGNLGFSKMFLNVIWLCKDCSLNSPNQRQRGELSVIFHCFAVAHF